MDAGAVAATTPEVAEQAPETTSEPEAPVPASDPSRQTAQSTSELETGDAYAFLQQQIYRGESDAAERDLQTVVVQIEGLYHRYHEDLVVPLTLLGDAAMVQGETSEALERYERARHIARVSYGLFDPRQMPVLYRESAALTRLGRLRAAGEREEQAYEVARRVYDEYDPELLPALFRLADCYLETYNYLAARALYNRADAIHEANHTDGTDQAIPALQGIARSHRLERFPPVYVHNSADNRLQGPTPGLTNDDLESQHLTFNNFPAGEKALQRIVEIRRNTLQALK
jgi:tetratricopeptide (TPR) repeat protein